MTTLAAHDIEIQFDGLQVLRGIDLQLATGEVLGLLGPNGAGKTTMVNVLTGFQRPTAGTVSLDGVNITGRLPREFAQLGIARTFQAARLFKRLTVLENIEVAVGAGQARRQGSSRDTAMEIASYMGLMPLIARQAGSLPYVDERRVGIARALALAPRHVLLDEPAAGMTEGECEALMETIADLPTSFGCGVLLIEHNMTVVMGVCSRLQVLNLGKTLAEGRAADVRANPAVIEAYMGAE